MKKGMLIAILVLGFWMRPDFVFATESYSNYHVAQDKQTAMQVCGRGLANMTVFPSEIVSTMQRETELHPKAWPVTYVPRVMTNMVTRIFSGLNDTIVAPWYTPISDDTRPWTAGLGLPDYPWQAD